jgi:Domain of unknown function (DUF4177)
MDKWEYKRTDDLGEAQLNDLGQQGWELVAVISNVSAMGAPRSSGTYPTSTTVTLIFKR